MAKASVQDGPPGTPRGKHSDALVKAGQVCRCGRCTNERLGATR